MPDSSPNQNNGLRPLDELLTAFDDGTLTREEVEQLVHLSRRAAVLSTALAATIHKLDPGLNIDGLAKRVKDVCNQVEDSEMTQATLSILMQGGRTIP